MLCHVESTNFDDEKRGYLWVVVVVVVVVFLVSLSSPVFSSVQFSSVCAINEFGMPTIKQQRRLADRERLKPAATTKVTEKRANNEVSREALIQFMSPPN